MQNKHLKNQTKVREMREELKKEVKETLCFLEEARYPVKETEDINAGYISLKEAVLQVLDESRVEYNEETIDEIIKEALEEYKAQAD